MLSSPGALKSWSKRLGNGVAGAGAPDGGPKYVQICCIQELLEHGGGEGY